MSGMVKGARVRVKASMYMRTRGDHRRRLMRGQEFVIDDGDDLDRSDIELILEVVDDSEPEAESEAEVEETSDEDDVWGESLDSDELVTQLKGMNIKTAKKFLSRPEWTADGLRIALSAEINGSNRDGIVAFIENLILDAEEMSVEEGT